MPRVREITVYSFAELDDMAKERARDWYRAHALDYDWWDSTVDDAKTCLSLLGFDIADVYFSGFASQGGGACFAGEWNAVKVQHGALAKHAPLYCTQERARETHHVVDTR